MTLDGWKVWQHVFVVAIFFPLQIFVFFHPALRNRRVYPIYIYMLINLHYIDIHIHIYVYVYNAN